METKIALIKALDVERQLFAKRGQSTEEHDIAIKWLESGEAPSYDEDEVYDNYELLYAAMFDYDTLCFDYL